MNASYDPSAWDQPEPLFSEPERVTRQLSQLYSHTAFRHSGTVRWQRYVGDLPCQECFAEQHEAKGAGWPRNPARWIRKAPPAPSLHLCSAHQALWKARDVDNS